MSKLRRNHPCSCGSGKKYKDCCFLTNYQEVSPDKIIGKFTIENGKKISRAVTSIDSIPTHNRNGLTPNITGEQMMDLCLNEIYKILKSEKVGALLDLVDMVIQEMDIIPIFTYRQIADQMENDGRFEVYQSQICSLKGTDPVLLMSEKLGI